MIKLIKFLKWAWHEYRTATRRDLYWDMAIYEISRNNYLNDALNANETSNIVHIHKDELETLLRDRKAYVKLQAAHVLNSNVKTVNEQRKSACVAWSELSRAQKKIKFLEEKLTRTYGEPRLGLYAGME